MDQWVLPVPQLARIWLLRQRALSGPWYNLWYNPEEPSLKHLLSSACWLSGASRAFLALSRPLRQRCGATAGVTVPLDWSALRPNSHGLNAISVSLLLIHHDGLTPWNIRIDASLVASTAPFFSMRVRGELVARPERRLATPSPTPSLPIPVVGKS